MAEHEFILHVSAPYLDIDRVFSGEELILARAAGVMPPMAAGEAPA